MEVEAQNKVEDGKEWSVAHVAPSRLKSSRSTTYIGRYPHHMAKIAHKLNSRGVNFDAS